MTPAPPGLRKILIVDDDALSGDILRRLLGNTGLYTATVETDSMRAIAVAIEMEPDVVLLDVVMPHIDGPTLARLIREQPGLEDMPVIYISGVVPKSSSGLRDTIGDSPFVPKPVDVPSLLDCMEKVIAARDNTGV